LKTAGAAHISEALVDNCHVEPVLRVSFMLQSSWAMMYVTFSGSFQMVPTNLSPEVKLYDSKVPR